MQFLIHPKINGRVYNYRVQFVKRTLSLEYYEIIGKDRVITLTCNRPIIAKKGLKEFPYHWAVQDGKMTAPSLAIIAESIEATDEFRLGKLNI